MQVKAQSSVDAQAQPYLHGWDTSARHYFSFFEAHKLIIADNLVTLRANPLTAWRDTIQLRHRHQQVDSLALR
jgi:hypothetical protein